MLCCIPFAQSIFFEQFSPVFTSFHRPFLLLCIANKPYDKRACTHTPPSLRAKLNVDMLQQQYNIPLHVESTREHRGAKRERERCWAVGMMCSLDARPSPSSCRLSLFGRRFRGEFFKQQISARRYFLGTRTPVKQSHTHPGKDDSCFSDAG